MFDLRYNPGQGFQDLPVMSTPLIMVEPLEISLLLRCPQVTNQELAREEVPAREKNKVVRLQMVD